jgi:hypothetical protein
VSGPERQANDEPPAVGLIDLLGNPLNVGDKIAIAGLTTEFPYDEPVLVFGSITEVDLPPARGTVVIDYGDGTYSREQTRRVVRVVAPVVEPVIYTLDTPIEFVHPTGD